MADDFSDFVSKPANDIYGVTTINHAKRVKMGLTVNQYCVADFVAYCNSKSRIITYQYIYRKLGIDKDQFISTSKPLIEAGFLEAPKEGLKVTRKWYDAFMIDDKWFDAFWLVNNKVAWPGSRKSAQTKFVKACKYYAPEFLIKCRDNYFKFLAHPTNSFRKKMAAEVFLNLETERFNEDWVEGLKMLTNPVNVSAMTLPQLSAEEKERMFL